MTHELMNQEVDIYKLPSLDTQHKGSASTQITIGDLHGNAMKLMFMLIKHGIATNISQADYETLVKCYKTPTQDLTTDILSEFNQILSHMTFSQDSFVRLIGDELADRGNNDYFTLKILEKLSENKVPVEILVSNHGIEFIEACEKQQNFNPPTLQGSHAQSMLNLQALVDNNLVTREEILKIVKNSYQPSLRAISYSLSQDKKNITIYSHAGIGLNTIKDLAQKLKIPYQDTSASQLKQTIDSINIVFQTHVQNNTVNTLYTHDAMLLGYGNDDSLKSTDAPFEFIMWNRRYDDIHRPDIYFDYGLTFVHGHDKDDPIQAHVYNLDNDLGKFENMNIGPYRVLYSREDDAAEELSLVIAERVKDEFLTRLNAIKIKERSLRRNGHVSAADKALALHTKIFEAYSKLEHGEIDLERFKDKCTRAIDSARPELEQHRGWKQVLGNLALAVIGLGVFYVAALIMNKATTGRYLFFKTDSAQKVDQLEESLQPIIFQK